MSDKVPKLRHHKGSGQFCVVLNSRTHYLGRDREGAKCRYDAMIQEWLANDRLPPAPPAPEMSITELIVRYFKRSQGYYSAAELGAIRAALRTVRQLYGPTPVTEFGPLRLEAVRQVWIDAGNSRRYCNRKTRIVKRMFRWGTAKELLPAAINHGLESVTGLRMGYSDAKDPPEVKPVDWASVEATIQHLPVPVRAMVRVHGLCAMRPGEVVQMTMGELNREGKVWTYIPKVHKTMLLGITRTVYIGPKAQEILRNYFTADPNAPMFTPTEKAQAGPDVGEPYSVQDYRRCVIRACKAAKVERWRPAQLRHSRATDVRRDYGLDGAQVILGHAKADTSEIYAAQLATLAMRIAEETG